MHCMYIVHTYLCVCPSGKFSISEITNLYLQKLCVRIEVLVHKNITGENQ